VAYRASALSAAKPQRRTLSIAAAPGWSAFFQQEDDYYDDPRYVTLAAWALVEEPDGETRLVGLVQKPADEDEPPGTFGYADEIDGFAGYANQGLKTRPAD
jgi:hypothetical protein